LKACRNNNRIGDELGIVDALVVRVECMKDVN